MKGLAVFLITVGSIMMIVTGLNLITRDKVAGADKLEIGKTERQPVIWSPIVGGLFLGSGIGLFFFITRRKARLIP